MSRATVTNMLGRMERDSLIARRSHPGDGRSRKVRLTRAGKAAQRKVDAVWHELETVIRSTLDDDEAQALHDLLRKIRDSLGGKDPDI